jgi:hypothetical protein
MNKQALSTLIAKSGPAQPAHGACEEKPVKTAG